jgi:hypothetical protein
MKSFSDFEIWIRPGHLPPATGNPATYEVQVYSSPAGTAGGELKLNLQDPGFQANLAQVSGILPNLEQRKRFGQDLFESLFRLDVLKAWDNSWGRIEAGAADGLRLSLAIEDPDLAYLPWELLHDPDRGFLAVAANASLSRYLAVPEPALLVQQLPLRILVIIESPKPNGLAPISELEQLSLEKALQQLGSLVSYRILKNPTPEEIQDALQKGPHVIHFLGHGTSSQLALVAKDGSVELINEHQFATKFLGRRSVRLVVLNACNSSQAADQGLFTGIGPALVKVGVPAVVAMQYPTVQLETAGMFSRVMYQALANGLPVDVAVNEGRNLLAGGALYAGRDWSTPVLYLGTRSSRILDFSNQNREVVEDAWANVQRVATQAGALGAITQLSQRFKDIADRHRRLRVWMDAANHLSNLRASYSFLDDQLQQARGNPQDLNLPAIKQSWTSLSQNQWQMFVTFLEAHQELNASDRYGDLVAQHEAVSAAIKRVALMDLQDGLNSYSDLLSRAEARIRLELDQAVAELVSFSDQTLPLLTT